MYLISLPWKEFHEPLAYQLSLGRLLGLLRRLNHDPLIFREYMMT